MPLTLSRRHLLLALGAIASITAAPAHAKGSVVDVRDSLNRAYYGKAVTPVDILVKRTASSKNSARLRSAVAAKAR